MQPLRLAAVAGLFVGCSTGPRAATIAGASEPCRGGALDLAFAYQACSRSLAPGPAPNAAELEVRVPPTAAVPSGGRVQIAVELRNRSGRILPVSFRASELSGSVAFRGRRIDSVCAAPTDTQESAHAPGPSVFVELLPDGILRVPISITAWGTLSVSEGSDCTVANQVARAPLPPGRYQAQLALPWSWSRTVPLEIEARAASLGSDWPRGEAPITCASDSDCVLVSGPCPAQAVNGSFAAETLKLHRALETRGACRAGPRDGALVARCVDTFCVGNQR